jgi:CBS domain-containing protein
MLARDLMTTDLVTVPPDMPLSAVARLMAERGISGVPVVGPDGSLLGMLTEGDLIRRLASAGDQPASWFAGLFAAPGAQAARFAKTHGRRARDAMTTALHSATEDTPVEQIAALFERTGIRRVPILRDGKLAGVLSRADLLRALLDAEDGDKDGQRSDGDIRRDIAHRMKQQPWADTFFVFPEVKAGAVTFYGFCRSDAVEQALRVLAEAVPGVTSVSFDLSRPPPFVITS